MNMIIFCIAVIGIFCTCYTIFNNCCYTTTCNNDELVITLEKKNVSYEEKQEIILRLREGKFEDVFDIIDAMSIN